MHLQLRTYLLLLVWLLTTPTPSRAATIGTRDGRTHFKSGASTGPSDQEPMVDRPVWETGPETSHLQDAQIDSLGLGGSQLTGVPLDKVSAIPAEPLPNASLGVAHQVGTLESPEELKPLLDVDELIALEFKRMKTTTTTPTPSTSTSGVTNVPTPVTTSDQPEDDKDFSSQLAEVLKSILDESAARGQPTSPRPVQPPRMDLVPQRPPVASTGDAAKFNEFLPQQEDAMKGVLVTHKLAESQPPHTVQKPTPHTPNVPDTEEHLKHILPTLEETIGSILKASEAKIPVTTSRPVVTPLNPTVTNIRQPLKPHTEEQLKHFLPTLEEAIGSILKDSEVKIHVTTSRPEVHPALPTKPAVRRPLQSDTEEHLKHILPTLEEALASILKDSEGKVQTTTARPVLPPVRPTTDGRAQFAAVMPQLEEAIRAVLDEAVAEQEAAAQQRTTLTPAWRPAPPATEDYGFGKFVPELERVFGEILQNCESHHGATFTSTVKAHTLPVIGSTEETKPFQNNAIEADSPSSHSEPLFQAVKSTLQDVFNSKEAEGKTPWAKS